MKHVLPAYVMRANVEAAKFASVPDKLDLICGRRRQRTVFGAAVGPARTRWDWTNRPVRTRSSRSTMATNTQRPARTRPGA